MSCAIPSYQPAMLCFRSSTYSWDPHNHEHTPPPPPRPSSLVSASWTGTCTAHTFGTAPAATTRIGAPATCTVALCTRVDGTARVLHTALGAHQPTTSIGQTQQEMTDVYSPCLEVAPCCHIRAAATVGIDRKNELVVVVASEVKLPARHTIITLTAQAKQQPFMHR